MRRQLSSLFAGPDIPPGHQLAARATRIGAAALDALSLAAGLALVAMPLLFAPRETGSDAIDTLKFTLAFGIVGLIWLTGNGVLLFRHGQTLGKRLTRIKIVRRDGSHAGGRILLSRLLPLALFAAGPAIGAAAILVDALFMLRPSRRCLHDELAGTAVVEV